MNCETKLASECAPKPPWPTGFERLKIHHSNLEKLLFKCSKIEAILLAFKETNVIKQAKIHTRSLLNLNCNFSGMGLCILDFSKPVGQRGFGGNS